MTNHDPAVAPSAALLAAQHQLLALREQHRTARLQALPVRDDRSLGRVPSTTLPPHLGWESERVATLVRQHQARISRALAAQLPLISCTPVVPSAESPQARPCTASAEIRLFPDIATGMLRHERAASGRVWLLLRHLDTAGQGHHSIDSVRTALTTKHAPLRICGWRQLRNLLNQGEGIFWHRHDGRIWLRSTAKVAAALEIDRLVTRPIGMPIAILTQSIGTVRAHFYATFHSGRSGGPIARETLQRTTAVASRTQRAYERRLHLKKQRNFAIGECATETSIEETSWRHGRGSFTLIDHHGTNGQRGGHYVAWQLPNSYSGPHAPHTKHARKRINRKLADLQPNGTAGNDQPTNDVGARRYVASGREASRVKPGQVLYWPGARNGIWHEFRA